MNSFECWLAGCPDYRTTVNSITAGRAKSEYFRKVRDALCDLSYTDIRCKKVGGPHTSDEFRKVAEYRGLPKVECGMRIEVEGREGFIVGHNSSSNFDVYFTKEKYVGNCHPLDEMKYFNKDGSLLYDTTGED